MSLKIVFLLFLLPLLKRTSSAEYGDDEFIFNKFTAGNLSLDGSATIANDILRLTTTTEKLKKGHAFYSTPLDFKSPAGKLHSFSTTFAFSILSGYPGLGSHGIAFVVSPTTDFSTSLPSQYLGLFNANNIGNATNHLFAVEFDTVQNPEFGDIDDNHVGIDINSFISNTSHTAGYYSDGNSSFQKLAMISGQTMQVWIDYNSEELQLNVTLSPVEVSKPNRPLLSSTMDLSSVMRDSMYVGFSSSTGLVTGADYVTGWSFKMNGPAPPLALTVSAQSRRNIGKALATWLTLASCVLLLGILAAVVFIIRRRRRRRECSELLEDWEIEYGPHRFAYKDLFQATRGFDENELLGRGGFGRVYRGVLPSSKMEVAVKRVSHESRQGMREFVAEIVSIGRLRHRNLVQLLGYCRTKRELLLVYELMSNGSLDKFLYDQTRPPLGWARRFQIIKGVASGLLYLHEEWEQVVIHRDIKASNVLLDNELNARLGDFGLARLYDHGADPHTTRVAGTMGYIAPELARTGKGTTATDVFAFGAFLLEVACGKRPVRFVDWQGSQLILVDWVLQNLRQGSIVETRDPRLGEGYSEAEVEMVLKLGLLCSHPAARPSMRQVMQFLDGDLPLPEISEAYWSSTGFPSLQNKGFDDCTLQCPSVATAFSLSGGR